MDNHFFAVFPSLEVSEKMRGLFEDVIIKRVATIKGSNAFRVFMESARLIAKEYIYRMQDAMAVQVFGSKDTDIKLIEEYHLSEQYTPKNLMEAYYDSILLELDRSSKMYHTIFQKAKYEFIEEDVLKLSFEDDIVARDRAKDIKAMLENVFIKRCNVPVKIEYDFVEVKKKKKKDPYVMPVYHTKKAEDRPDKEEVKTEGSANSESMAAVKAEATPTAKVVAEAKPAEAKATASAANNAKQQSQQTPQKAENKWGSGNKGSWKGSYTKKSDDPDVFYGRNVDEEAMPLVELVQPMGEVTIRGQIIAVELKEIRNEKTIIMFSITDYTDTVKVKIFVHNDMLPEISANLEKGAFIKLKGMSNMDTFDNELSITSVVGIKKIGDFRKKRMDTSEMKRVELHCHTKMSDMDGVSDVKSIIKCAMSWGHKAIAITDHGVVQAFTDANHAVEGTDFKLIYGVEGYLVDDTKGAVYDSKGQSLDAEYVVYDIETTGFHAETDEIIEIGAVKVVAGKIVDRYNRFVNPQKPIPYEIEKLTGINDSMVINEATIDVVLPEFLEFCGDAAVV
ncbi:MAG: PHP domain-containing protein, partial [Lachnospiraceae bacterium]|nr:PHP domain-containing protein [Lachnospiraceae bacterium]